MSPFECPPDESLVLELDGELPNDDSSRLRRHLLTCTRCASRFARLSQVDAVLGAPEDDLPEQAVERALAVPASAGRPAWVLPLAASFAAAAAGLALLLAGHTAAPPRRTPRSVERATVPLPPTAVPPVVSREAAPSSVRPAAPSTAGAGDADVALARTDASDLPVLHRLARGDDTGRARRALEAIGRIASRSSLPAVMDATKLPDRRTAAVAALVAIGDPAGIPALAPLLDDDTTADTALAAIEAIGGDAAALAISRRLQRGAPPEERDALVAALGRVGRPAAADALLGLLRREDTAEAARRALEANASRLVRRLVELAEGGDEVRAREALEALATVVPSSDLPAPTVVAALRPLLAKRPLRGAAACVLARLDTRTAAEALLDAGLPAPTAAEVESAAPALETLCLERLAHGDRRQQNQALAWLARCGTPRAVPELERAAADPALAPTVLETLAALPGKAATGALRRLGDEPTLARSIVPLLAERDPEESVPALLALGRTHPSLTTLTIRTLASVGTDAAVEAMVRLDGRPRTRGALTHSLKSMERGVVVPTLVAMLDGELATEARRALRAVDVRAADVRATGRPCPSTWIQ